MDLLTKERRSWNMSRISGKSTRPELTVRALLHQRGLRFRIHAQIPGTPDIVLSRWRTAIFVNGCFWHRHKGCKYCYSPKSNQAFWHNKFHKTISRDRAVAAALRKLGWRVEIIWECELKDLTKLNRRLEKIFSVAG